MSSSIVYKHFPKHASPSPDYVHEPEHPPSPDYVSDPKHPPLPDYIPSLEYPEYLVPSDDEEDPMKDHAEYPVDEGDKEEEESSRDDADDEDEEEDDDDEEEKEEHLASANSFAVPIDDPDVPEADVPPRKRLCLTACAPRFETPATYGSIYGGTLAEYAVPPTPPSPPPYPFTPLLSLPPQIPSPPLPLPSPPTHTSPTYAEAPLGYRASMIWSSAASPLSLPAPISPLLLPATDCREDVPEADVPPRNRLCLTACAPRFKVGESSAAAAARQPRLDVTHATDYKLSFMIIEIVMYECRFIYVIVDLTSVVYFTPKELLLLWMSMKLPKAAVMVMIVTIPELAKEDSNGDDSHDSRTSKRRQVPTTRECTYNEFLKCQPLNFKGTKGVVGLTQRFEKMEYVFHISNCTIACQIKFSTCTLQGNALTWWNSYVRTVSYEVAYGMT
nr:hypothetical protein [Tanacetum cinerariifolium]